uniref:Uncharacterized protein n=1 Tax=Cacopsylla melanoneura TaxID=428564 RepID=A0A8D9E757_9HEMI
MKSSVPHVGYLDSNSMPNPTRRESNAKLGATAFGKPSKPETEAQRAARLNKQFEKMIQFTTMLGHVDSFLYDRARSVVKTLHRMMGDSRELIEPLDFETNELRRRRHSNDFERRHPTESRVLTNEVRFYEPVHQQTAELTVSAE